MFILQIFFLVLFTLSTPIIFSILKISQNDENPEGWISIVESKTILQLREYCADVLVFDYEKSEQFLLNWLIEYEMDVQAACEMMREARQWREVNGIDTILNETDTILTISPFLCYVGSVDDAGKHYLVCLDGRVDVRKLLLEGRRQDLIRAFFYWIERVLFESREIARELKKPFRPVILIADIQGFNFKQHTCAFCIELVREIFTWGYKYYPRLADTCLLINAPKIALPWVDFFRKPLGPYYGKIMHAVGSNKTEISEVLLSLIPRDHLLSMYGGTKVIDD